MLVVGVVQYCGTSWGFMCNCLARPIEVASLIVNVFAAFWSYSSGFIINTSTFPPYLKIIQYISPYQYGFAALAVNELKGNQYDCPYPAGNANCEQYNGDVILDSLNLANHDIWINVIIVAGMAVAFDVMALVLLLFIKQRPK